MIESVNTSLTTSSTVFWVSQGLVSSNFIVKFYYFIHLISYGNRTGKLKAANSQSFKLMILAILSVALSILYTIYVQIELMFTLNMYIFILVPNGCSILRSSDVFIFYISSDFPLLYFWYRQWVLYSQPGLKQFYSKTMNVINVVAVLQIILPGLFLSLLYFATVTQKLTASGCVRYDSTIQLRRLMLFWLDSGLYSHLLLFGLFLYPILRHYHQQGQSSVVVPVSDIVNKTIYRSLLSIFCYIVASSCLRGTISLLQSNSVAYFVNAIWDISAVFSCIAIAYSYDNRKSAFFGSCKRLLSDKRSFSVT